MSPGLETADVGQKVQAVCLVFSNEQTWFNCPGFANVIFLGVNYNIIKGSFVCGVIRF